MKLRIQYLVTLAIVLLFIASCKKEKVTYEDISTSTVMLFNAYAVSATPALTTDAYFDGQKITMNPLGYATLLTNLVVSAGTKEVLFKRSADSSLLARVSGIELAPQAVHTIYLTGTAGSGSIVVTNDDYTPAPEGKAKIRAIHLSPNMTPANFYIADGTTIAEALPFKSYTQYALVDTGAFIFQVRVPQTHAVRGATASIRLASRQCYTFIARGLVGGNPGLTLQVLNNIKPF